MTKKKKWYMNIKLILLTWFWLYDPISAFCIGRKVQPEHRTSLKSTHQTRNHNKTHWKCSILVFKQLNQYFNYLKDTKSIVFYLGQTFYSSRNEFVDSGHHMFPQHTATESHFAAGGRKIWNLHSGLFPWHSVSFFTLAVTIYVILFLITQSERIIDWNIGINVEINRII